MNRNRATLCLLFACSPLFAVCAGDLALESDNDKTLYALGLAMARQLSTFQFTEQDLQRVQAGLADGALGREPRVELEEFGPKIDGMLRERMAKMTEVEKTEGTAFVETASKETGAIKTDSGMIYKEIKAGAGEQPTVSSTVKLHYQGTLRTGKVFDSSVEGGEPASFALGQVAPCFAEGVQRMRVGGKSKLVCPPDLAYGDRGAPPMIPPGATLVFDVELLEITPMPGEPVPEAPVSAAPIP